MVEGTGEGITLTKPTQRPQAVRGYMEKGLKETDARDQVAKDLKIPRLQRDVKRENEKAKVNEELTLIDPLTGLYNKRFFEGEPKTGLVGILEKLYKDAIRGNDPLSLVIVDIDRFKEFNDSFGHKFGDKILKRLGNMIKSLLRDSDFGVRYGGEEFAILLPSTDALGAEKISEMIRKVVAMGSFDIEGIHKDVTISSGIATFVPNRSGLKIDDETFFKAADAAMYQAKQHGRNQSWAAEELPDQENQGKNIITFHKASVSETEIENLIQG